ncbi:sensor histidine kinase [Aeromicrobium sp. CTD01-1L150]|uniref:sensor histidine kinase n=1 Tax=Aeromicrobium sp. CTD01-1L150 TaxID=3341830 RepID=UPI0035BFD4BB
MSTQVSRHEEVPDWVLDVLVAAAQAISVALIIAIGSHDSGSTQALAYLFAVGFGAVLLLRRRFPVLVLVVAVLGVFAYYAASLPPIGMALPVVGAFYAAAGRGRVVVSACIGVLLVGVSLYFRLDHEVTSSLLAYDVITNAALIGCAIALASTVRSRQALREQHERVVRLQRQHREEQVNRQVEAERVRLARDVHDSVGHALSLVSVQARVAQQSLGTDDAAAAQALDNVVSATGTSLADLRRTLTSLSAAGDREPAAAGGLGPVVDAARDAGLEVDLQDHLDGSAIPPDVSSVVFRIVQEALTNVLRHARATRVWIRLEEAGGNLVVRVEDDGRGAEGLVEGRGIRGMRERVGQQGGTVSLSPGADGLRIDAVLPIGAPPAGEQP